MGNWYYTFGSDAGGGWAIVNADNRKEADAMFCVFHPKKNGFLDCASVYSEETFKRTPMYENGNFGVYCVEEISARRKIYNGVIE